MGRDAAVAGVAAVRAGVVAVVAAVVATVAGVGQAGVGQGAELGRSHSHEGGESHLAHRHTHVRYGHRRDGRDDRDQKKRHLVRAVTAVNDRLIRDSWQVAVLR